MKTTKTWVIFTLISAVTLAASVAVTAEESESSGQAAINSSVPPHMMYGGQGQMPMMYGQQGQMPMMYGQQGQMPMMYGQQGQMPWMQMMQQRQAVMDEHMKRMEAHMANIESLLQQLVELQKK